MVIKKSCRTLNFEQLLFLEIFELLYKFGSNLDFKMNGNSVIIVNSATTTAPPPTSFCSVLGMPVATLGFVLAQAGHCVSPPCSLGRPIKPATVVAVRFHFPLLCFSRRHCSTPASFHHRCSASTIVAKPVPAPSPSYTSIQPALVA